METIKILLKKEIAGDGYLRVFDLWAGDVRRIRVPRNLDGCRTCIQGQFDFLEGAIGTHARILCGRGAVQIQSAGRDRIDLHVLSTRLKQEGRVTETPFLVRFDHPPYILSVFADGRAIVQGTENPDEARKIYARFIGS
jgi:molybdopterin-synthase adenylyltransferase